MKTLRLLPLLAIAALNLTACDIWTVKPLCERQFVAADQAAACAVGASEIADQIRSENGTVNAEKGQQLCTSQCSSLYSSEAGNEASDYVNLADLQTACIQGCQASVEYQRAMELGSVSGCEQMRGPGGIVRCE